MVFKLQLFGAVSAQDETGQEIRFRDDKVRALLAYLAVERSQAHPREKLLELFWGNASQERAQHSLRMALTRLRQSLEQAGLGGLLHVTRQTAELRPHPDLLWIDAVEFDALAANCRDYSARDLADHTRVNEWMTQAVDLYRGSFLSGISLRDSPSFDHWLTLTQSRYEQQTLNFLDALAERALAEQQGELAEQYARRQLDFAPWQESAHRQLMRVFAQRGRRQLVAQQYQKCAQALETELGVEPEAETIALFEQLTRGDAFSETVPPAAPRKTFAGAPNNLPPTYTPFFGRESERGRLIRALLDDTIPLVTVVGPGGAGKTRLTLDGVRHVLHYPAFRDGVWFVPLDALRAGDQNLYQAVAGAIANALGLDLLSQAAPHAQLFEQLKSRNALLILDNFEQLIAGERDGVDFAVDLIRHAPHLKLLVSSRRPLNLQMEMLITLDGLPAPQSADDSAYAYSSVLLFMERGRRACPSFSLDAETLPAVVEICRILDGMPLALELVAVRLREMNCAQILQALATNLDLLKSGLRDLPRRHQSMRAVFDWSWSLLSLEEKRVLGELSVFRGSFALEAAQSITGAGSEQLSALIDHSLIRFSEGRYSLHELLRQFAEEKLEATAPIYGRHSGYYLGFAHERADRLLGKDLAQASAEIKQEWENIQQAWMWAVSERDLPALIGSLDGLGHYLRNSGMIWFGEKLFQSALDNLLASDGEFYAANSAQGRKAIGFLWLELARGYVWSAQYESSAALARRVIELGNEIADPDLIAGGNLELGRALWRLGEYQIARNILEDMLPLSTQNAWIETQAVNTLGNICVSQGMFEEAERHYQRALSIQKQANIWSNRVQVLNNLATIAALRGQFEQALGLFLEVLAASRRFNQQYFQISIYLNLGLCHCALGQYAQAESYLRQSLELSNQVRNRQNESDILLGLAQLYRRLGKYKTCGDYLEQALALCRENGAKNAVAEALMQFALFYFAQGHFAQAHQASQESVRLIQELGPTEVGGDIMITSGYCCLALQDYGGARAAFSAGFKISRDVRNPLKKIEAQAGLACIHLRQGERQAASDLLEEVWQQLERQDNLMGAILPYDLLRLLAQSLAELNDARAGLLLNQAHTLIQAHAQAIPDPAARRDFMRQPICRDIAARYDARQNGLTDTP